MREVVFTFEWYDDLIDTIVTDGYDFADFHEEVGEDTVLLRHDVDWSPRKAVRLADIEADHDVTATYFFLVSSPFYNPMNEVVRDCIDRIIDLGHDVGLHFSTHQHFESTPDGSDGAEPPGSEIVAAIDRERTVLETAVDTTVDVVSFHNPPEWTFRRSFDGFVSTYETRFFDDIAYVADSNQRWRDENPFTDGVPAPMQLLTHPILWGELDAQGTDRLREERDYLFEIVSDHLEATYLAWEGQCGIADVQR